MRKIYLLASTLFVGAITYGQSITTFDYTGAVQTFNVPPGVTSIEVEVIGAQGGNADGVTVGWGAGTVDREGGLGGRVTCTLPVTGGETLEIYVGGQGDMTTGGFNGGGSPASCTGTEVIAAGGGGASDIRQGGSTYADRVVVAGGGGGASGSANDTYASPDFSGAGGGLSGADATTGGGSGLCTPGAGGTASAGGLGGDNSCWCGGGLTAGDGSFGLGGDGECAPSGLSTCSCSGTGCTTGGGGGGGYYGGGAGICFAGGGGGSSYTVAGATSVVHDQGYQTGNGQVIITILCTPLDVTVSSDTICESEELTLSATSTLGGTVTWGGGVVDGTPFIPDSSGTLTYVATSTDPDDCITEIEIYSMDAPEFSLSANDELVGGDGSIFLTLIDGLFPFSYDWDNDGTGDFDDTQSLLGLNSGTYVVEVMHANGCSRIDSATVSSQVGIVEAENSLAKIYPNPSSNVTTIELEGEFNFTVVSTSGERVMTGSGKDKRIVDISTLASGTYVVAVEANDVTYLLNFIKQ